MLFHNLTSVTEETASSVVSNVEKWHDIFGSIASVVTIDNASTAPVHGAVEGSWMGAIVI